MRAWLVLGLCAGAAACDPVARASFAVAPGPVPAADSAGAVALAIAARVAARHGFEPVDPFAPSSTHTAGWAGCLTRAEDHGRIPPFLCGTLTDGVAQFELRQRPAFTRSTESLRRELLDSLRAGFGAERVRECGRRSDRCGAPAQRDSGNTGSAATLGR